MRTQLAAGVAAALTAASWLGVATAAAAPDYSADDKLFFKELMAGGIDGELDASDARLAGLNACNLLEGGEGLIAATAYVFDTYGYSGKQASSITFAAQNVYCPHTR